MAVGNPSFSMLSILFLRRCLLFLFLLSSSSPFFLFLEQPLGVGVERSGEMESKRFRFGFGSGSSGGSRKGRKSSSKRPKQPQRGLGVAQLEKIRLQSQMNGYVSALDFSFPSDLNMEDSKVKAAAPSSPSSSGSPTLALHPNITVGHGNNDKRCLNYVEHWSDASARSQLNEASIYPYHYHAHPVALPLFQQSIEDAFTAQDTAQKRRRHDRSLSLGSIGQISDPNQTQELDLELKLSL